MTGYLVNYQGTRYKLPVLNSYYIAMTDGRSAGSFDVSFTYEKSMKKMLDSAVRLFVEHEGKVVFYGVVDEYQVNFDGGSMVTVSGRDMAGLLMDNEAAAADFYYCGIDDILERYVYPYGIATEKVTRMSLYGFSAETGSSCFSVLSDFTKKAGGIIPFFTGEGKLDLSRRDRNYLKITDASSVFDLSFTKKRYGRLSQVTVRDVIGRRETVTDEDFIAQGGMAGRITMVTKDTARSDMRYTGEQMIKESKQGCDTVSLSLPTLFAAEPGDRVSLSLTEAGVSGEYLVTEIAVWADGSGAGTRIMLEDENNVAV